MVRAPIQMNFLTAGYTGKAVVTSDSSDNIYIFNAFGKMYFAKFDSTYTLVKLRYYGSVYQYRGIGISFYNNNVYYFGSGDWSSSPDDYTTMIYRSDSDLDFSVYQCT